MATQTFLEYSIYLTGWNGTEKGINLLPLDDTAPTAIHNVTPIVQKTTISRRNKQFFLQFFLEFLPEEYFKVQGEQSIMLSIICKGL